MKGNIFIKRPVMAISISVLILAIGLISLFTLPVEQYPDIAPPTVYVTASYTGADAEAVMNSVIMPLEESINGVEDMMYISSSASNAGLAIIQVYFKQGTDPDMAAVNVQNRVAKAQGLLPAEVTKVGVSTMKRQTSFLQIGALVCTDGRYDQTFLANYLDINVIPQIKRIEGVGDVMELGDTYSMRIWLKPERMAQYGLVPSDITAILGEQNIEAPTGSLGESSKNVFQFTMKYRGRLKSVEEFRNTVVRSREDGSILRLQDVAEVELGTMTYSFRSEMDSQPAVLYMIFQTAGSNATAVNKEITTQIERMEKNLPEGTEFVTMMSSNDFLFASIHNVVETLIIAIILVILVVYFFLQDLKSTLIPSISIIVSLVGTFACLVAAGFSLNILTLFALVLAIGTVVDDAIVVVEAVQSKFDAGYKSAYLATKDAMGDVTMAIVSCTCVFMAVFIPVTFMGGTSGVFYTQFGITMATAVGISMISALTLCPALCAIMMHPSDGTKSAKSINGRVRAAYNASFNAVLGKYKKGVMYFIRHRWMVWTSLAATIVLLVYLMSTTKTGRVPQEDQGVLMMMSQLPDGATLERTDLEMKKIQQTFAKTEAKSVESVFVVRGFSFAGTGQNMALGFLKLRDWSERTTPDTSVAAIQGRTMGILMGHPDFKQASTFVFPLPPVPELGVADGFDLYIQDNTGGTHDKLMQYMGQFLMKANADPRLTMVRHNGMADTTQLKLVLDYEKLSALNLSIGEVNSAISTVLSGSYVNDYMDRGRVKQVWVMGNTGSRMQPEDILGWHVRNANGEMVPIGTFAKFEWSYGSPRLERFNGLPAVNIQGNPRAGVSSGQAMAAIEEIAKEVFPTGYEIAWNGVSYQEKAAGNQGPALFALSILVVFLCLAALYESWSVPIAVLLVVPCGVVGALGLTGALSMSNDIYFQVGLLTTIGLVSKNAILIVEFAKEYMEQGKDAIHAAEEAVRVRLRPILMTSLAFGLGVLPLAMAHGAGAGAQNAIGVGVLGGMLAGTFLCIAFVPVFYVLVDRFLGGKKRHEKNQTQQA